MQNDDMKKMAEDILNKRKHERFRATLQVRYRQVDKNEKNVLVKSGGFAEPGAFMAKAAETQELNMVISEDISAGGLKINTAVALPQDSELWVNLKLPEIPIPVNALAIVAWTRQVSHAWSSGLRFLSINVQDMQKVEKYVALNARRN